jgi:hypothetical protein
MTKYEIWNLVVQSAVGVGTILVAVLAIWGDLARSWWSGPKLKVRLLTGSGELTTIADGTPVRYYHVKVTNGRKWSPPRNVRVLITKILLPASDGSWVDRSFSGPLQLTWQFPQFRTPFSFIGPDDVSDLGYIPKGQRFILSPYIVPNNFTGFVEGNQTIRAEITAVADNGQSDSIVLEIAWNGSWSDNQVEMSQHLVIKEVTG